MIIFIRSEDAQVQLLIVEPHTFGERALKIVQSVDRPFTVLGLGTWGEQIDLFSLMEQYKPQLLASCSHKDDDCVLIYTGGTTGKPKERIAQPPCNGRHGDDANG